MALLVPRSYGPIQPPPGLRPLPGHPYSQSLKSAFVFTQGAGQYIQNCVTGKQIALGATNMVWKAQPIAGMGVTANPTGVFANSWSDALPSGFAANTDFSLIHVFTPAVSGANNSGNRPVWIGGSAYISGTGTTVGHTLNVHCATADANLTVTTFVLNKPAFVCMTWKNATNTLTAYTNGNMTAGSVLTKATTTGTGGMAAPSPSNLFIGNDSSGVDGWFGYHHALFVWVGRILTQADVTALYAALYQMFSVDPALVWPGPAGGATSNLWPWLLANMNGGPIDLTGGMRG